MATTMLRAADLAERWNTTSGALSVRRQRGTGPAYVKAGRSVLYPLAEVERYEAANLRTVTSGGAR